MANDILEFEKPIHELQQKIVALQQLNEENDMDMSEEIAQLTKKLEAKKKNVIKNLTSWQKIQLARHPQRPYFGDYVDLIFTDFLELHGDRRYADDGAMRGGFAKIDGHKIMLIGTQKGRNLEENKACNFGSPYPEGYRKALRLMQLAERAHVPIVTLIDTPGAYPGIESEERHIGEAIAVNLRDMSMIKQPILAIVTGEGGSGGALGIGIGNKVLIMENAYYSVITPEGCAAILWRDGSKAPDAAEALKLTSSELKKNDLVDEIIKEPVGGAHRDPEGAAEFVKKAIIRNLKELQKLSAEELITQRYDRFRKFGDFNE
ncbi:MAG: acetyl-CoA carboxylase carboxyltransferase subunit alpha [Verrucomicrobiota bacterium]|nr:acetyl-CoA carboxylase carboxyltransferase subunit alpha [Verrucomicrobiota bacterium]